MMGALGLDVWMPNFLNGPTFICALEENRLCYISEIREIVESANSRVKHFK